MGEAPIPVHAGGFHGSISEYGIVDYQGSLLCPPYTLSDGFWNQLLKQTELSSLAITLSSYNRQIESVGDLERLLVFKSNGGNSRLTREQAEGIVRAFKQVFFEYLNGVGHVPGMEDCYVTKEEYDLRASDRLFRAKVTLRQLTDSWLLPVGDNPQSKVKVRDTLFQGPCFVVNTVHRSLCTLNRFSWPQTSKQQCSTSQRAAEIPL